MIWLIQDFGFLSVILRAITLTLQTLVVGGILFVIWILPRTMERARLLAWLMRFAFAFALVEALYVATDSAILTVSTGLPLSAFFTADYFLAGATGAVLALSIAVAAMLARRSTASTFVLNLALSALAVLAMLASLCTSHAVSRMDHRLPLALLTLLHQSAAAAWIGSLFYLLIALRDTAAEALGDAKSLLHRYAWLASIGAVTLIVSGILLSAYYIGSWPALYGTAYGFMVLCKAVLLLSLLVLGAINFSLNREGNFGVSGLMFLRRLTEIEIWIGFSVILAAASLTSQPPAVDLVQDRLTGHEIITRFTPQRPHFDHPGAETLAPATPQEVAIRNFDNLELTASHSNRTPDMAWDEFDHHWVGLMLLLVGFGALLSPRYKWARHWPLVFFLMTIFLLLYADPENWPIGPVSFWQSFADPEVLQHRIYFCLLTLYGIFEWGVQTGRLRSQRAAGVFPALVALGGAALLLHSHTLGNVKQELLVEMSHNTLGILGIFTGSVRWLEIRLRDVPDAERARRIAAIVWPGGFLLTALVLLNYREY
jgi:putative copper resistance protein D